MISRSLKIAKPIALAVVIALLAQAALLIVSLPVPLPILAVPHFDNVYVSTHGNDLYDGSSPTFVSGNTGPKKTITEGISVVNTYGTVNVAAGTYVENIHLDDSMNLIGAGALSTIIDGNNDGTVIIVSSDVNQHNLISGFTIQNGAPGKYGPGGGVYIAEYHTVTINDCAIINNTKVGGVSIASKEDLFGTHTVYADEPVLATTIGGGGGVCNAFGALYMNRCTVSGNTVEGLGGGIAIFARGVAVYKPTEPGLCQPVFAIDGEDGVAEYGRAELTNCTISGNTAESITVGSAQDEGLYCFNGDGIFLAAQGGGIYCEGGTTARLLYVTIANNKATGEDSRGGGFSQGEGPGAPDTLYFKNCIVAGNTAGDSAHNNGYDFFNGAGVISEGYNIDSQNSCYFNQATDKHNTNPQLGPLKNNGGPTSTHAITDLSPAYNVGNCNPPSWYTDHPYTTDQRGISRPQNGKCDIGAYELVYTPKPSPPKPKPFAEDSSSSWSQGWASPPNIVANNLNVQPQQAAANQPITIYANMANRGEVEGPYTAMLKINGQEEAVKSGIVQGNTAVPLKFTISKEQPGTYEVDVNGQKSYFTIAGEATKSGLFAGNTKLLALALWGILVIAVLTSLIIVMIRRRQSYY